MKISVVIPVYNEEKYIGPCLQSFMNQEEKADEIIVVDNNCKDATVDIAKKFNVTIMKETKQGFIPARNKGFNSANYEIIARCDADTVVPPDWIKKIKKSFQSSQIIAVTGPIFFYDIPALFRFPTKIIHTLVYFKLLKLVHGHEVLFGSNMAIKKSAWEKVKNELCADDTQVHEDVDLAIHSVKYGKISYNPSLVAYISFRRLRNIKSAYFEYPFLWFKMLKSHKTFLSFLLSGKKRKNSDIQ